MYHLYRQFEYKSFQKYTTYWCYSNSNMNMKTRLNNCTSLLSCLLINDHNKLQTVQNSSARAITLTKRSAHITVTKYSPAVV